ncbi:two component, sigma54 specific, transcriptional regulator, Fis family [Tranquillimonas rosea]|uniref:Two component, sigma54 specific, transcriptional regulator, Fis family n=1 Tax=Tranquillimonas rosea TaxID=641238 RepID=A0A1H9V702_9RHOB|nr:sigma-54 dependent transcriptional regulator [Tranquillimonas rosea]SES17174.1 two component, sigma54 specific, transcriptional regulator, Fis family [Tranquillimonas rosea]
MIRKVLLVDDEPAVREALAQSLELADLEPVTAGSFTVARDTISAEFDGVIVSDIRMPGKDGFVLLDHAQNVDPELPVIFLTGQGDIPMAVRGMSAGAFDFLEKPCAASDLVAVVEKALRTRALVLENRRLKLKLETGDAAARMIFGESRLAAALRDRVRAVARTTAEVLLTGAPGSGTGKVAEVIHLLSGAAQRPFQKLPGALATPETLRDAFTAGRGGTVFIDEVAELTPPAQHALLDLLEAREGARVVAGTYRDLTEEVEAGRFNADLFYRLDLVRVRIPALKERPEDIPVLFRHYVSQACEQAALPQPEIDPETLSRLMEQDWPGNARAVMNAAMRFAMGLREDDGEAGELGLSERLAQVERSLLIDALRRAGGNATEAARGLKLPRKTFYDKLARHGISAGVYRDS